MKVYEPVKLEIIDFRADDAIRTSGDGEPTSGVYERVSELNPNTKEDWF